MGTPVGRERRGGGGDCEGARGGEEGIRDPFVSQGELLQRYNGIVMEKNIR